jgi:hypothetical protein
MRRALTPWRLVPQRLAGPPLDSPADVVGHFGAVQSQLHDMSLWALGRRCGATLAEVEAAFAAGEFVRTHPLRPTWHHVLRSDLRDLLEITAPRIRQAMASNNRGLGLTDESLAHWGALAVEAIRDGGPLTRPEVEAILEGEGFARVGNSMAHVMIEAELSGEIHSGPLRGRQHTYVAADLPLSRRTPDERLAWIARTYLRAHGPARAHDLAWWSDITLGQARRAVELAGAEPVTIGGAELVGIAPMVEAEVPAVLLLPPFDELISYARDGLEAAPFMGMSGLLFVDGELGGSWSRKASSRAVVVTVQTAAPLSRRHRTVLEQEVEAYGAFVGLPAELVL